jgi:hypothetical protein
MISSIAKKEYVPSNMYEINKYLMDYIYNTGTELSVVYTSYNYVINKPVLINQPVTVRIKKGPGYNLNAPIVVSRLALSEPVTGPPPWVRDMKKGLQFMTPTLPYSSYSEIINITVNGKNDINVGDNDQFFFTCGDLSGTLKLSKPDDAGIGIFDLIFTPTNQQPITYYSYHVDPIVNSLDDIPSLDLQDFLSNSPDLHARLCALRNIPESQSKDPKVSGISIFDKFLIDSSLYKLTLNGCDDFITTYCGSTGAKKDEPKYKRPCSCISTTRPIIDNQTEQKLYDYFVGKGVKMPVKCISSYCRDGGYYNNETTTCPDVCGSEYNNGSIKLADDLTVQIKCEADKITIVPSAEEQKAEDEKKAALEAQDKIKQDEQNKKNQTIVNNYLNLQKNINFKKFIMITSIILFIVLSICFIFVLYKIIKK